MDHSLFVKWTIKECYLFGAYVSNIFQIKSIDEWQLRVSFYLHCYTTNTVEIDSTIIWKAFNTQIAIFCHQNIYGNDLGQ